jgi:hypothetical protein
MRHGASGISTCQIRMVMNCRLRVDLAVFQQMHELILRKEELAERLPQHWWAQVLSGMGFPE